MVKTNTMPDTQDGLREALGEENWREENYGDPKKAAASSERYRKAANAKDPELKEQGDEAKTADSTVSPGSRNLLQRFSIIFCILGINRLPRSLCRSLQQRQPPAKT